MMAKVIYLKNLGNDHAQLNIQYQQIPLYVIPIYQAFLKKYIYKTKWYLFYRRRKKHTEISSKTFHIKNVCYVLIDKTQILSEFKVKSIWTFYGWSNISGTCL